MKNGGYKWSKKSNNIVDHRKTNRKENKRNSKSLKHLLRFHIDLESRDTLSAQNNEYSSQKYRIFMFVMSRSSTHIGFPVLLLRYL